MQIEIELVNTGGTTAVYRRKGGIRRPLHRTAGPQWHNTPAGREHLKTAPASPASETAAKPTPATSLTLIPQLA